MVVMVVSASSPRRCCECEGYVGEGEWSRQQCDDYDGMTITLLLSRCCWEYVGGGVKRVSMRVKAGPKWTRW